MAAVTRAGQLAVAAIAGLSLRPLAAAETPRPNVVLITLDTTRADHLGAWGWPHAHTPHLDALAARGTRFARCDSAAPITLPSHATILTGLYPPRHGVRDNGTFMLAAAHETLAERLRSAGYDTAAVVSAVVLARRHGLDQGFRLYDDDLGTGYAAQTEVPERAAGPSTDTALTVLANLRPPFFLWVHYFDPHEEYRPPSRFADAASGPHRIYDAEIAAMDAEIGRLLAALPVQTVVAAVGDHGEMLGELGELSHGILLGPGARRVPLLFAGPGVPAGRVETCLARTADVAPTLLALAGLGAWPERDGIDLLAATASPCQRTSYSESFLPFFAYRWYPPRALSDGTYLYQETPAPRLFRLADDAGEERDIAAAEPTATAEFGRSLRRLVGAMGDNLEPDTAPGGELTMTSEARAALASLGYLPGSGGRVTRDLPDGRAMVSIAAELHGAAAAVRAGDCAAATGSLESIVRRDPHNVPALNLLGQCRRSAGREAEALAIFERAASEHPTLVAPLANVAASLLALGRRAEAEQAYARALVLDPTLPEAATALARLRREGGEPAAAVAVLDSAIAAGGHAAALYLERGVARAESGQLEAALDDFRAAARRDPLSTVALENAGRAAYHLGRAAQAAPFYEALLRLAPERGDVWKTLGAIYAVDLDRPADAQRCFRAALALETDPDERRRLEAQLQ
jgi:arylsulfatase A-like enzyme/Tfp pilus assembly protein PilF